MHAYVLIVLPCCVSALGSNTCPSSWQGPCHCPPLASAHGVAPDKSTHSIALVCSINTPLTMCRMAIWGTLCLCCWGMMRPSASSTSPRFFHQPCCPPRRMAPAASGTYGTRQGRPYMYCGSAPPLAPFSAPHAWRGHQLRSCQLLQGPTSEVQQGRRRAMPRQLPRMCFQQACNCVTTATMVLGPPSLHSGGLLSQTRGMELLVEIGRQRCAPRTGAGSMLWSDYVVYQIWAKA